MQAVQDDPDFLSGCIMLAGRPLDVFDELLARAFACSSCLSHLPLLSGYDEPTTLSYQITLCGPISADVRHFRTFPLQVTRATGKFVVRDPLKSVASSVTDVRRGKASRPKCTFGNLVTGGDCLWDLMVDALVGLSDTRSRTHRFRRSTAIVKAAAGRPGRQ